VRHAKGRGDGLKNKTKYGSFSILMQCRRNRALVALSSAKERDGA